MPGGGAQRPSILADALEALIGATFQEGGFEAALQRHCREASLIVEQFAGEWFSKTKWEKGDIGRKEASGFAYVAMKKICAELKAGAHAHVA